LSGILFCFTAKNIVILCYPAAVTKSRRISLIGRAAHMGEKMNACIILLENPEGNRPLSRPRLKWETNIKMDLRAIECGVMEWIDLEAQNRDRWRALVNTVMNHRVP
jgi:hypothetical protein